MTIASFRSGTLVVLALLLAAAGCVPVGGGGGGGKPKQSAEGAPTTAGQAGPAFPFQAVDLNDPVRPVTREGSVVLSAAKNEWSSFAVQLGHVPANAAKWSIRFAAPKSPAGSQIPPAAFEVYQILPMPVDVNRAGYVRHTGLAAAPRGLPRALLPVRADEGGVIGVASLRDPQQPGDPNARAAGTGGPVLLWVDLHVPPETPAGQYAGACELTDGNRVIASVPLQLTVYDFALPAQRHLQVVGKVGWDSLERHYADRFEAVRPRLLNRNEPRYEAAIRTLDGLVTLAQRHRASLVIPRLQPTVKWPANAPPQVDWRDFDSVVTPWLSGQVFANKAPLGYWPLPAPDELTAWRRPEQLLYWEQAARHFDQNNWLGNGSVWVETVTSTPGRPGAQQAVELSALAAEVLSIHPRLRVTVPLEDDQIQFAGPNQPKLIDAHTTGRMWAAAPGLVSTPPVQAWPPGVERPDRWLRTDVPGLVPYVGAGGDERDVRLWAWLAYFRQPNGASRHPRPMVVWDETLPRLGSPTEPADPNELIWFYPGEWFGLNEPVPTIQLKWLRRAQQDFEYLWLAGERGDAVDAVLMARLMTKPVEIQPGQAPDPTYGLMSGTTDPQVWSDVLHLLATKIQMRAPGRPTDRQHEHAVDIAMLSWIEPQERPLLMGRTTLWGLERQSDGTDWLFMRLGLDIYNASDTRPDQNRLQWTALPAGWQMDPRPVPVPPLATYHVRREHMDARFDPKAISPAGRKPVEVVFTNGFNNRSQSVRVVAPVAASDRREGQLAIDGRLEPHEWMDLDLLQDGPLVRMLSRPDLQRHQLRLAEPASKVYSGWAEGNFYVAFELEGISPVAAGAGQNFVNYQFRRAWGEDLCELLVQPVDARGAPGPALHVVCKPNGVSWVERKPDAKQNWQEVQANVRYAARVEGGKWRGEVAIPWKALLDDSDEEGSGTKAADVAARPVVGAAAPRVPPLLRFNFVQHRTATGESASWCGPVDFGRDESMTGVLFLRDPEQRGFGVVRNP